MQEWDDSLLKEKDDLRKDLDRGIEHILLMVAHRITRYKMRCRHLEEENAKLKEKLNGRPDTPC